MVDTLSDSASFKAKILEHIKAGKPLNGKDGVLTPLIKKVLESALEEELEAHLNSTPEEMPNRRNGKTTKLVKSASDEF